MTSGRFLLLLLLSTTLLIPIQAAHSRRRPTTVRRQAEPRYDRSITTFDTFGRLQQVEYSMEAASQRTTSPILCMTRSGITCIAVLNSSDNKIHRITDSIVMCTSGLVGDSRLLASTIRQQCQDFERIMGEAPSIKEAAKLTADIQHLLTRTPGRRPLGCTGILAGVNVIDGSLQLFQTDPGGILEECHYCAAGKHQEKAMNMLESLWNELSSEREGESTVIDRIKMIQGIAKAALESVPNDNGTDDQPPSVDVWILRPDSSRRGGLHVQCIQRVVKDDLPLIDDKIL